MKRKTTTTTTTTTTINWCGCASISDWGASSKNIQPV